MGEQPLRPLPFPEKPTPQTGSAGCATALFAFSLIGIASLIFGAGVVTALVLVRVLG